MEPARNFALKQCQGEWILVLDPDERVTESLGRKIREIIKMDGSGDYYRVPRKNIIFGKWMRHSRWWPDYNVRFFKKGFVKWNKEIHSVPITSGEGVELALEEKYAIEHFHYETVEQFIERMNRYTTQAAKNKLETGEKFNWRFLISKPTSEFVSRYFFGEGYKDGVHGLALSSLQAFSELVIYLKIWQGRKFSDLDLNLSDIGEEIIKSQREMNYWKADANVKTGGGIKSRIKRRFKL